MKNSSIPLILTASFFAVSAEIWILAHLIVGLERVPLILTIPPLIPSSLSWLTLVSLSVLGILLAGTLLYANEEGGL